MPRRWLSTRWTVIKRKLMTESGGTVEVGCKHRGGTTACGGCHARLYFALEEIKAHPDEAANIVAAVFLAMEAEPQ